MKHGTTAGGRTCRAGRRTFARDSKVPLILQEVLVHKGETVSAGATLGALADYSELYIEGRAFEQDMEVLSQSAQRNWKITAVFEGAANSVKRIENLDLVYSASEIDAEARSLSFFVRLPNEVAREVPSPNGQRFLDWKYRPGQRLQLLVPVEEWENQIVLPVDAIAREGAESLYFSRTEIILIVCRYELHTGIRSMLSSSTTVRFFRAMSIALRVHIKCRWH